VKVSRRAIKVSTISLLALLAVILVALSVQAQVSGPCTGTINGQDFHGTVTVPENNTVAWEFNSNAGFISSWAITLYYASIPIPVDTGEDEDPDKTTKGDIADVSQYAKYGVGIYQLTGTVNSEGGACTGTVNIIVQGNPLTTLIGATAAGATAVGAGGAAASSVAGAKGALAGIK
jgi:hypothetical protein